MNTATEREMVDKFVIRDKRKRVIYELGSVKKRDNIIQRLIGLLDNRYVVLSKSDMTCEELEAFIRQNYKIPEECYVIEDGAFDGNTLPFGTAFEKLRETDGCILLFCGDMLIAKEEVVFGSPSKLVCYRGLRDGGVQGCRL